MILTGIADEAGALIDAQIKATKELGWNTIEARTVEVPGFPKGNLHDIPDEAFDVVEEKLKESGVGVYCFTKFCLNVFSSDCTIRKYIPDGSSETLILYCVCACSLVSEIIVVPFAFKIVIKYCSEEIELFVLDSLLFKMSITK